MQTGDVIGERFVVEAPAGAGGMGLVFRARDRRDGRDVALKILRLQEQAHQSRFLREASVLRELAHPTIPRYVDHGTQPDGAAWLAMEWVDGETLTKRLRQGALEVDQTLALGHGVATALAAAHRAGVIHRDIKPSNIMLVNGDFAAPRVVDFGVARYGIDVTLTRPGVMIGTPGYMSPEQARGERDVDARTDLFSLGCVLFECLTGRPAFAASDILALLAKLVLEDPPLPSTLVDKVPATVDALLRRLLAKTPMARPTSAEAVVQELESLLAVAGADAPLVDPTDGRSLTNRELRWFSVVVASGTSHESTIAETEETGELDDLDWGEVQALAKLDVRRELLADGTLVCAIMGSGLATDQATTAAECSLVLRARRKTSPVAIASGRGLLAGSIPVGEVIDRAVATLRRLEKAPRRSVNLAWVAVDELTAGLLDTSFDVRTEGDVQYLAARRDPLGSPRTLLGRKAPFVGRDRELSFIVSSAHDSFEQRVTSVALLTAPAGAGKSRLVWEALERIRAAHPGLAIWAARADVVGKGSPFALVGQLIRRAAGIADDEPIDVRRRRLEARVARHATAETAQRLVPFLGEISGTRFVASADRPELRDAQQDPTLMREQIERAWIDFVRAETEARPVVLIADDLQWGDLPSVKLLGSALRKLPSSALFVIGSGRPTLHEAFPDLWSDAAISEMRLARLNAVASRQMIREVLGDVDVAKAEEISTRAAGNAFYLEELIRAVSQGKSELPRTLVATMNTRLEALDPGARRLLRAASVFGDTFWRGALVEMLADVPAISVDATLSALSAQELVEVHRESRFRGQAEYAFRHALLREAAYETLIPRDLETAHHAAGVWLESVGEDDAVLRAEHFERGGARERAATLFRRAAEQALEGSDYEAAASRAERGMACGATGDDLTALRYVRGEVHAVRGENVEAERCATEVLERAARGSAYWCWAASTTFALRIQLGELASATTIARELATIEPDAHTTLAYVRACADSSALLAYAGLTDTAREMVAKMNRLFADAALIGRAWICYARAWLHAQDGDLLAMRAAAEEGGALFVEARSELGAAALGVVHGAALDAIGDLAGAAEQVTRARAGAERLGAGHHATFAKLCEAVVATDRGEPERSVTLASEASASFWDQGSTVHFGWARVVLAVAFARLGQWDDAEREAGEGALFLEAVPVLKASCETVLARIQSRGAGGPPAARLPAIPSLG